MLKLRALCFCLTLGLCFVSTAHARETPDAVVSQTLLKTGSSWDGVAYQPYAPGQPELSVIKLTIAPHTVLPWHTHPMPNAAYVLSGELWVQPAKGGQERKLVAGDVLAEMVDTVHRGKTGEQAVELIVFYAGVTDMPLSRRVDRTQEVPQ